MVFTATDIYSLIRHVSDLSTLW